VIGSHELTLNNTLSLDRLQRHFTRKRLFSPFPHIFKVSQILSRDSLTTAMQYQISLLKKKVILIEEVRFSWTIELKTICATAVVGTRLIHWISALRPYFPGRMEKVKTFHSIEGVDYWGL